MEINEKCGIFGIHGNTPDAARIVYYGLWTLQHRGQECSGIACSNGSRIRCHKGEGLVAHVYNEKILKKLTGNIAIGHNRYSTFGNSEVDHSQPVYYQQNKISLAHNGNLPQVQKLKQFLTRAGKPTAGLNDSEMMFKALEYWVVKGKSIEQAVELTYPLFTGAFSLLVMDKQKLVAVRDSCGIRPLSIGKLNGSYVFSSETCAFDTIGAEFVRDVLPGEMVTVDNKGLHSHQLAKGNPNLDVFEFIYFSRPDSILLGKSVYEVRKKLGAQLARETKLDIDIVVPVPDSSIPSAIGYSKESGIPIEHALVKNRYIHRTFIKPSQKQRSAGVKMKLNLIKDLVKGKKVALVDDSIVRGTTSQRLVKLIRNGGAKEVHLLVTSPPVRYPDFYGINTPTQKELIASIMTLKKLKHHIGVETLNYLSLKGMLKAIGVDKSLLCTSCFTGIYPINIGYQKRKINFKNL
jgi:amidophosphoribosyltransferase